jgi:hypothetical protein
MPSVVGYVCAVVCVCIHSVVGYICAFVCSSLHAKCVGVWTVLWMYCCIHTGIICTKLCAVFDLIAAGGFYVARINDNLNVIAINSNLHEGSRL